jgi:hypothetical protein
VLDGGNGDTCISYDAKKFMMVCKKYKHVIQTIPMIYVPIHAATCSYVHIHTYTYRYIHICEKSS